MNRPTVTIKFPSLFSIGKYLEHIGGVSKINDDAYINLDTEALVIDDITYDELEQIA